MIHTRYRYASELARGCRVLEIACAAGVGFGMIDRHAAQVVGGDVELALLQRARQHYGNRYPLVQFTAERLPFRAATFDLVLFFEATYYVPDVDRAFDEVARILAAVGTVVFVNANPERAGFVRSPHAVKYHTAAEFREALENRGFEVEMHALFPLERDTGLRGVAVRVARTVLKGLGLVPRSLKSRAALKRVAFGTLVRVPAAIDDSFGSCAERHPWTRGRSHEFKVIYATGKRSL